MALSQSLREQLTLPAVVAPMFLVSCPALAVASCRAGLLGTLTRNNCRTHDEFEAQLTEVRMALDSNRHDTPDVSIAPLGANISIGMPREARSAAIAACGRHGVSIVITAGGDPKDIVSEVHDCGGLVFHDVTSIRFAEKAIAAGVDGLIAIGAGGGGHSGRLSHFALVPQIRAMFDGVIVMAGAVASGAAIRAAEILGADLAYLGTRFIATQESAASDDYKAMLVSSGADDLTYTDAINGVPAMWLDASLRERGLDPANLPRPAGRGASHLPDHVKPWKNLWSGGQGISLIRDVPTVAALGERLRAEYHAACAVPSWPSSPEHERG